MEGGRVWGWSDSRSPRKTTLKKSSLIRVKIYMLLNCQSTSNSYIKVDQFIIKIARPMADKTGTSLLPAVQSNTKQPGK